MIGKKMIAAIESGRLSPSEDPTGAYSNSTKTGSRPTPRLSRYRPYFFHRRTRDPVQVDHGRRRNGRAWSDDSRDRGAGARHPVRRTGRAQFRKPAQRDCERHGKAVHGGRAYQGAHRLYPQDDPALERESDGVGEVSRIGGRGAGHAPASA
jgi:hypothetical protein